MAVIHPGHIHGGTTHAGSVSFDRGLDTGLDGATFDTGSLYDGPALPPFVPKSIDEQYGSVQVGEVTLRTAQTNFMSDSPGAESHPVFTIDIRGPSADSTGFLAALLGPKQESLTLRFDVGSDECPDEQFLRGCCQILVSGLQVSGGKMTREFMDAVRRTMPVVTD